jgi:hypothetical protein
MPEDNKLDTNTEASEPENTAPLNSSEIQDIRTCSEEGGTHTFIEIEKK